MKIFDGMMGETIKKAGMSQLKKYFTKEGTKVVLLKVKPDGDFDVVEYKEDVKVLTMSEYNTLIETVNKNLEL